MATKSYDKLFATMNDEMANLNELSIDFRKQLNKSCAILSECNDDVKKALLTNHATFDNVQMRQFIRLIEFTNKFIKQIETASNAIAEIGH